MNKENNPPAEANAPQQTIARRIRRVLGEMMPSQETASLAPPTNPRPAGEQAAQENPRPNPDNARPA